VIHDFPNKSKMADCRHIELRKMLIAPYWIKIFAPNLIQAYTMGTTIPIRLSAYNVSESDDYNF